MVEIVLYLVGIFGVILVTCGISWTLEVLCDGEDDRGRVTSEDLAEMARYFDEDGWFVDYNDKGEKFYCGYMRD